MLGQNISHYRILEKLGEGGMGVVYKAEDTKLGRTVALKFLAERSLQVEELNKRFMREAQAAARLDHPNICTVYGLEEAEGRHFLVMACLDGETLQERLQTGPLTLGHALDIVIQAAQGLQEAHEHSIVHRDVKPGNIFLTCRGLVKITDFSLAFLVDRSRITKAGNKLGTVNYMSPEQFQTETVDRRTDIWSLGVVLYEMLCGYRPFHGRDVQTAMGMIMNSQPRPPAKVRKNCPPELDRIIGKTLSKDREERYQHMDDMIVDLRAVRDALPAEERQAAVLSPRPPTKTRAEAPTQTVAVSSAQVAAASASASASASRSSAQRRTGSGFALLAFGVLILAGVLIAWLRFLQN